MDYYIKFQNFIDGQLEILNGDSIQEVSSWFFEQTATKFLENPLNVQNLTDQFHSFEGGLNL